MRPSPPPAPTSPRGGRDTATLARRYGSWVAEPEQIPGSEVPDAGVNARHVTRALVEGGYAVIDVDGLGGATYHLLKPSLGMRVRPFAGSAPTDFRDRAGVMQFANTRAAAYWHLRDLLDPTSGRMIAVPPGRQVLAKKRLGRSPDVGDAIVMAFWDDTSALIAEAWAAESSGFERPMTRDEESLPWNRPAEPERFVPWGAR